MFNMLKKVIGFFWKQKKYIFFILSLSVLFFIIRFPWNDFIERKVRNIQKQSPSSVQTDFESLRLQVFPPGVEFKNLTVGYKKNEFLLDSLRASISIGKWLALKQAWRVHGVKDDSSLFVEFWNKEKVLKDSPEEESVVVYSIKGHSPYLNLKTLNSFFPDFKMSGMISSRFNYEGSLKNLEENQAYLNLKGKDISFSQVEFNTPLGPFKLPPINWKKLNVLSYLKEGEIIFKNIHLGESSDELSVEMKGSGAVKFNYGMLGLSSYNIQLRISAKKTFKVNLLDLMFSGFKEDKGSYYRYQLRLIGQGNQVPNMEKLDEF